MPQGVAPPMPCVHIVILDPPDSGSMECVIHPNGGGIGYPVGHMERIDDPVLGTYYRDAVSRAVWVFTGGPATGQWHDLTNGRSGTWGPC